MNTTIIRRKSLLIVLCLALLFTTACPLTTFAYTKGSTGYLVDQAKHYEGETLAQVKNDIKAQGYNGWNMNYNYDWCAWYVSNCANAEYIGNYPGMTSIPKNTFVDQIADNFAKYNGTTKKYPGSYTPKAGDIVVEGNQSHVGIMISSTKAAYGNDGSQSYPYTKVKIRAPYNVQYYVPRANWYMVYYSDNLKTTSNAQDMKCIPPVKVKFGKSYTISTKKFKRTGYTYSHYYIVRQDFNKKTGTYTNLYWSKNKKTGKAGWHKSGEAGYTKLKYKAGSKITFNYNINFAGGEVCLMPVWVKQK